MKGLLKGTQLALIDDLGQQQMTALFPTFTSIWQRAKRLLSTDTQDIWQLLQTTESDELEGTVYAIGDSLYW